MLQSILLIPALLFSNGDKKEIVYNIDASASKIEWYAEKVTGNHSGVVNIKDGAFTFDDGKLVGGSFTVDMTSLESTDLEGEWKQKLDGHLKSDDFFGVETYPTSTFVIKEAVSEGAGKYKIVGDITIKGITKEIEFTADIKEKGKQVEGVAEVVIDRTQFDIRYGSNSFFDNLGDKAIYDDFKLSIRLIASK